MSGRFSVQSELGDVVYVQGSRLVPAIITRDPVTGLLATDAAIHVEYLTDEPTHEWQPIHNVTSLALIKPGTLAAHVQAA